MTRFHFIESITLQSQWKLHVCSFLFVNFTGWTKDNGYTGERD